MELVASCSARAEGEEEEPPSSRPPPVEVGQSGLIWEQQEPEENRAAGENPDLKLRYTHTHCPLFLLIHKCVCVVSCPQ